MLPGYLLSDCLRGFGGLFRYYSFYLLIAFLLRCSYLRSFSFSILIWVPVCLLFIFISFMLLLCGVFWYALWLSFLISNAGLLFTVWDLVRLWSLFVICGFAVVLYGFCFSSQMPVDCMLFGALIWFWSLFILCVFLLYAPFFSLSGSNARCFIADPGFVFIVGFIVEGR